MSRSVRSPLPLGMGAVTGCTCFYSGELDAAEATAGLGAAEVTLDRLAVLNPGDGSAGGRT